MYPDDEDPRFAEECENGHYYCQRRCPVDGGCQDSCDHTSDDVEPDEPTPPRITTTALPEWAFAGRPGNDNGARTN